MGIEPPGGWLQLCKPGGLPLAIVSTDAEGYRQQKEESMIYPDVEKSCFQYST